MSLRRKTPPLESLVQEALRKALLQLAIAQAAAARHDTPLALRIADGIAAIEELKTVTSERLGTRLSTQQAGHG
jgi:hypothetical protein